MRNVFCAALVEAASRPDFVFLTGDLGYKALEPLRDAMGQAFVNAGVSEQNMVGVAAGLAKNGQNPWVYSIAPFVYARAYEQIRNDVCFHDLPVKLVGNGGGYGYGPMGPTHHALEDYGAILTLPNICVFIPAFARDLPVLVSRLFQFAHPAYLRLGLSELPDDIPVPTYAPWRRMLSGHGPTMVVVGPIAGRLLAAIRHVNEQYRPTVWVLSELPLSDIPEQFLCDLAASKHLLVVEEHVAHGGAGQMLAHSLLVAGRAPQRFTHRAALRYPSGLYGSQQFHRRECGLDPDSIIELLSQEAAFHE